MRRLFICFELALFLTFAGFAQDEVQDLAKTSQNPVADLITVPIQYNAIFDIGPLERVAHLVNVQPVYPIHLSPLMNLITRWILPIAYQPDLFSEEGGEFGIGDLNPTFFLSPTGGATLFGIGATFVIPTATEISLGADKWSVGPAAVLVATMREFVLGVLANNIWSFAGEENRPDINQFLVQPFVNYNVPFLPGFTITSSPIIKADWNANSANTWTVPLGGGVTQLLLVGKLPVSISVQAYSLIERPSGGADWLLRAQMSFLFPK